MDTYSIIEDPEVPNCPAGYMAWEAGLDCCPALRKMLLLA